MRIAVINAFFPPRVGGSAHLSEAVARRCAEDGHEVLVITAEFANAPLEERHGSLRIVRLPALAPKTRLSFNYDIPFAGSPSNRRRLQALLDEFRPDIVHQHGQFFDLSWMSARWAKRANVPVVLTVHTRLISPKRLHGAVMAAGDWSVIRHKTRSAKPWIIAVDGPVHKYVRRRYGIPEARIFDIPPAIEIERFDGGDGKDIRRELGIGDRPMILSLGHVIPLRDRVNVAEALPYVRREFPDVAVVVVGNVYNDQFLKRAEELGVRDSFICTGSVPKDRVPAFAAAADLEAHDLQGFLFSTASLEMFAAGVPIVTNAGDDQYPIVKLTDGENMIRPASDDPRDLAEAFLRLLRDPMLRESVGNGGRQLARGSFSLDVVYSQHVDLYQRVITEHAEATA